MSGPTTVILTGDPVTAILSAVAIRAAIAVAEGYENARVLHRQHEDQQDARSKQQRDATASGLAALNAQVVTAKSAFAQINQLADQLGIAEQVQATLPSAPDTQDSDAIAAYVRALQALAEELRTILLTEAARQADKFSIMPDFALETAVADSVPQTAVQRLLKRIAHLGAPPASIQKIAQELERILPGERADLLTTELRAQIQSHIEALQKQQMQEATSLIVAQSLKDLGYQVEDIADTLFVEGGVVHFRRQSWGNYMVRMRVDAKTSTVNFNVIRAIAEGDNARSVLDHLAEDRWCTEFPALLQALEVRGIHMNITRRLEAGELPVQLVAASKLPKFTEEDISTTVAEPLAKKLP